MNVFVDYIHSDLYYSLHLLFEKRLKMNLFRHIGTEWHGKGIPTPPVDPFEINGDVQLIDDIYHVPLKIETESGYHVQKAITFNKFLQMDFDIVVTTSFQYEKIFHDLLRQYKPNTVFIRQIGNIHEKPLGFCKNVLLSTLEPMPKGVNYITYYPENAEAYHYTPPTNHKLIRSFSHYLPSYPQDLRDWNRYKSTLNEFTFGMHGIDGQDGYIPHTLMPQAIKESAFVWHLKAGGGGFIPRQAMACGRPCIVRKCYCDQHNTLCKNLFHDSVENGPVNCIDLDLRSFKENIKLIKELSQPDRHIQLCKSAVEQFKKDVNFAEQAERIKQWILHLRSK